VQEFPLLDALSNGFGERFLQVRSVGVLLEAEQIQSGRSPTARFSTNRRFQFQKAANVIETDAFLTAEVLRD
jgi:hypothetical protein